MNLEETLENKIRINNAINLKKEEKTVTERERESLRGLKKTKLTWKEAEPSDY